MNPESTAVNQGVGTIRTAPEKEPGTGYPGEKAYVPPKGWDELTSDEKIERMRELVKQLFHALNRVEAEHGKLKRTFYSHQHKDDKIVKEVKEYDGGEMGAFLAGGSNTESNYF